MTHEERTYGDYYERQWMKRGSKKGRYAVIAILITVLIVVAVLVIDFPSHSLYWHVDKGDEFTFSIVYQLDVNDSLTDPEYLNSWLEPLNDTVVSFRVVNLPRIPPRLDAESFPELMINHIKSNCAFVNGTAVPEPYNTTLNTLFSNALMPSGDWDFIDDLFKNTLDFDNPTEELQYEYAAWIHDNIFYMIYDGYSIDELRGWWCHIDMNTGLPVMIEDTIDTFDSSGFAMSSLMLIPS